MGSARVAPHASAVRLMLAPHSPLASVMLARGPQAFVACSLHAPHVSAASQACVLVDLWAWTLRSVDPSAAAGAIFRVGCAAATTLGIIRQWAATAAPSTLEYH